MSDTNGSNGSNGQHSTEQEYIENWDVYFLSIAETVARKSKDPRCQVGAVIVSADNVLLSTGFNGLARGVVDSERILDDADEKLKWICHAEMNAILNAARTGVAVAGCSIYVNKFPCLACCNAILQAGIARVYTHDKKFWGDDPFDPTHDRKRATLKQSRLKVHAPFHPEFNPQEPVSWPLRRAAHRVAAPKRRVVAVTSQRKTTSAKRTPH
jgi:dCMP deaminase